MRISAGAGKGRKLKAPAGTHVRPTSDKVKQALFNILGDKVADALFLDLYAGAGGVGIEALSRGARRVFFVDDSRESLRVIKQNIEHAGLPEQAVVVASKAESFLTKSTDQFDVVFLDPPYRLELQPLLDALAASHLLKQDGIVIAEHFKKQKSPEQAGRLSLYREARYGDTILAFYKVQETP